MTPIQSIRAAITLRQKAIQEQRRNPKLTFIAAVKAARTKMNRRKK